MDIFHFDRPISPPSENSICIRDGSTTKRNELENWISLIFYQDDHSTYCEMLLLLQLRLMNGVRLLAQMVQDWNMDLKDHRSNPTGDAIAVAAALLLFPLLMLTDEREIAWWLKWYTTGAITGKTLVLTASRLLLSLLIDDSGSGGRSLDHKWQRPGFKSNWVHIQLPPKLVPQFLHRKCP